MAKKTQDEWSPEVPDFQIAGFNKKLLEKYKDNAPEAERQERMIALCGAGVSPDIAARACCVDDWESDLELRKYAETAYAQFVAKVEINVARTLTTGAVTNTLTTNFLQAKAGWNPKAGEGWHQNIKILPVVLENKLKEFDYREDYADKLKEQAENEDAGA